MRRNTRVALLILSISLLTFCNLSAQEKDTLRLKDTLLRKEVSLQKEKQMSVGHELSAIIASKFPVPILIAPEPEPSNWKRGSLLQLGFTQTSFSNWASGGNSSVALNANVNISANYTVKTFYWENRLQLAYGFIQQFGDRYKKSDDKFIIDSKIGYKAWDHVFASAIFNFKTQMTNGFTYPSNADPKLSSSPFSPAYMSLGLGLDYKPVNSLSFVFSPLTGNLVMVERRSLRIKYGNAIDEPVRLKLGAQFKVEFKKKIQKNLNIETSASFFSDFLGNPENIKVNWDLFLDARLNKFFSTSIRTNFIYDDDVLIANDAGELAPRIQFKEILQVGFSYTFGEFKK